MIDLKGFRKANKLTQADLAKLIGISRSFIGQIECGASKLPDAYLQALLANKDYDTSMLVIDNSTNISAKATGNSSKINIEDNSGSKAEIMLLRAEVESLKTQLAKAEAEKEKYWEMIQKLMK